MKLHLGCGERYLEDYIHIDLADYPHIDHKRSVSDLSIFDNKSCDLIYASHVIEYFDDEEVIDVLEEWKRVLKTNGILRLAVPNFQAIKEVYDKTNNLDDVLGPLYGKWNVGNNNVNIYHKTVYDYSKIYKVLERVSFNNIKLWKWEEVFTDDYDDHSKAYFPHMDNVNGIHISLNIECTK